MKLRRAVFLDRDGTINRDVGYLSNPLDVELLPHAVEALKMLRQQGFILVLVSNQSGVGRGLFTLEAMDEVHNRFMDCLHQKGVDLDGAYYCPHAPWDGCECRKPLPGMLRRAAQELDVDLSKSFIIGDKLSDIEAGQRAGCRTVLLRNPDRETEELDSGVNLGLPDHVAADLLVAARWVLMRPGDKSLKGKNRAS